MRTVPPTEKGKYRAIATGAIANGKPVVVNSAGTVSVVSGAAQSLGSEAEFTSSAANYVRVVYDSNSDRTVLIYRNGNDSTGEAIVGQVSGTSISYGSPVTFETGNTEFIGATFDSNSNRIVIVFRDGNNTNYGTAVVGNVNPSDNSISFGNPVVFHSGSTYYIDCSFDSNLNKVLVTYADGSNSDYGACVVGTVDTSSDPYISFGSEVVFASVNISGGAASTFDSANNKSVVVYSDNSQGRGIVGTISGTSISFGSATALPNSGAYASLDVAYDTTSGKVVVVGRNGSNSNEGEATVGTVSGTSISFGTTVTYKSSAVAEYNQVVFDTTANKAVVIYRDQGDSNKGKFILGTVSGTDISFAGETEFNAATEYMGLDFDSSSKKVVIGYKDAGDGDDGTVRVLQNAIATNLTTENYIGIANSCSFHGATETFTVTVASGALYGGGGTGNVFYLNGLSNPPIQLLKGHTYIFDQSDSTNSGHPLHFKNTGGSQYTSGVTVTGSAGSAGAKVTIVIPSDATEPSQYYCTAHGNGMGNLVTIGDSFVNVDVIGTVNDQQSSLTAGQQYFVQEDGTLGLTADSTSVFAGTAISATELVVKE